MTGANKKITNLIAELAGRRLIEKEDKKW
jgi:hypothetical protein